jgi:hypothetical protein
VKQIKLVQDSVHKWAFLNKIMTDRLERILTMVYVVQSYWACFGLYPSSCMWKTNKPNSSVQDNDRFRNRELLHRVNNHSVRGQHSGVFTLLTFNNPVQDRRAHEICRRVRPGTTAKDGAVKRKRIVKNLGKRQ